MQVGHSAQQLHHEQQDGFPLTSLREVALLKRISHPNCVSLLDVAVGRNRDGVFLVAYEAGRPVGCGALRTLAPGVGEVRHLWVHGDARGLGLGRLFALPGQLWTALFTRALHLRHRARL